MGTTNSLLPDLCVKPSPKEWPPLTTALTGVAGEGQEGGGGQRCTGLCIYETSGICKAKDKKLPSTTKTAYNHYSFCNYFSWCMGLTILILHLRTLDLNN